MLKYQFPKINDPVIERGLLVCQLAGDHNLLERVRAGCDHAGISHAVAHRDDHVLLDWLISAESYQGVSDAAATTYMEIHGRVSAADLTADVMQHHGCRKLDSFWAFEGCGFHKGSRTCAEPDHISTCPLPRHDLRNGRLNQTAYALSLFVRDIAGGDLVGWIDRQLEQAARQAGNGPQRRGELRQSLLEPLGHVYGVSNKVLSMVLADLLLGADPHRALWVETGASMIAIDTLVHNWLHRTGILVELDGEHPYGARCYGPDGCEAIIEVLSAGIDARLFNADYPADFPRFVQKAIWRFCAQAELNECNGNQIDDSESCSRLDCGLGSVCARRPLRQM